MLGAPVFRTALFGPWSGNALWTAARAVPSLDLCFADKKDLICASSGRQLVTFARASSGTYVDSAGVRRTAATDVPRFDHNPLTGESLGLLVEEQRTNLLLYSACDSNWFTGGFGTPTYNLGLSALGVFSGVQIASGGQNWHSIYRPGISLTALTTYAFTLFYRAGTSGRVLLTFRNNSTATETVINGLVGSLSVSAAFAGAATVLSQYLCSDGLTYVVTGTFTPNSTSADHWYRIGPDSTTSGQTVIALGAQLEAGAFATSYIPTTSAAATRSADVASITGTAFSSWYRQDEGTVFAECAVAQPASGGNQFIFRANDNSFNNNTTLNIQGSGFASIATAAGGVFDGAATSALALSANTAAKFAGAYAVNNLGVSLNGATAVTDTSATMPTALNRLDIGSDHIGANRVKAGTIRRLTFFPTRLANNILQSITQ